VCEFHEEVRLAKVFHYDLYGLRDDKYEFLLEKKIDSVKWNEIEPSMPQFFFVRKDFGNQAQYENGFSVKSLFTINGVGITTAHDDFVISDDRNKLYKKFMKFKNYQGNTELLYNDFGVQKKKGWDILKGWNNLQTQNNLNQFIKEISYRPFDIRFIFYEDKLVWRTVRKVMMHFINGKNIGLITARSNKSETCDHFYVTKNICETKCGERTTQSCVFPLYLYVGKKRRPNLNPKIINEIEQKLNLSFVPEKGDNLTLTNEGFRDSSFAPGQLVENSFAPLDLFDYICAVLHSPAYRETYREFLKIDFPRVPYPVDQKVFWKLAALGGKLRQLHLLEGPEFEKVEADSVPSEKVLVEKVRYSDGKVYVNDDFCFECVSQTAWEFYIGGYQPAQKWLKDRKGCMLKTEDLKHYRKIVLALTETARIMEEIDKVGVEYRDRICQ
jgi:predicted helicase